MRQKSFFTPNLVEELRQSSWRLAREYIQSKDTDPDTFNVHFRRCCCKEELSALKALDADAAGIDIE